MSMTSKTKYKIKKERRNIKRWALINYNLKIKGYKQADICADLDLSSSAVSLAISGLGKISRVDEWIEEHLGINI